MSSGNEVIKEVFEEIRSRNIVLNQDSIPHSDEFINYINASHGLSPDLTKQIIAVMINAHMILTIEITSENKVKEIQGIDGYVVSDLSIIKQLKSYFNSDLARMYEVQYRRRLGAAGVIQEIFPKIKSLMNTPIGMTANKAIMLNEYERLLEKNLEEYTEEWKQKHLEIEIHKANLTNIGKKKKRKSIEENLRLNEGQAENEFEDEGEPEKAKQQKQFVNYLPKNKNYPLDRILKIYGLKFFFKTSLKRYKFNYLTKVVETSKILGKSELLALRDMLRDFKSQMDNEDKLIKYREEIYILERAISHNLYFSN